MFTVKEATGIEEDLNLRELTLKASFSLTNSHPVLGDVYPRNPNSVNIAGIHIGPPKQIEDVEIRDSICKSWRNRHLKTNFFTGIGWMGRRRASSLSPLGA